MKRSRHPVLRSCVIAAWAALAFLAGGCRYVDELLEAPELAVDPRQVFPGFTASTDSANSAIVTGSWDFPPCAGWNDEAGGRLRLGDLFTAELPRGEGWAAAEGGRATIVVRYPSGSSLPSAYLYAERIDAGGLGTALQQFHARIDRRLKEWPDFLRPMASALPPPPDLHESGSDDGEPPKDPAAAEPAPPEGPATEEPVPIDSTASAEVPAGAGDGAVTQAPNPAALASLAVGYASEEGSFSGWRWIGVCTPPQEETGETTDRAVPEPDAAAKPFLRLSRSRGSWRLQPGAQPVPAFLALATVTLPERRDYGVHLAIVCSESPQCHDAPALARLLGSIRVASGTAAAGLGWGSDAFRELAEEAGVSLPERGSEPVPVVSRADSE